MWAMRAGGLGSDFLTTDGTIVEMAKQYTEYTEGLGLGFLTTNGHEFTRIFFFGGSLEWDFNHGIA